VAGTRAAAASRAAVALRGATRTVGASEFGGGLRGGRGGHGAVKSGSGSEPGVFGSQLKFSPYLIGCLTRAYRLKNN
jgi:hypothetical protein